ncbi:MAG: four helix bundle protein [Candidatus Pacebacteria bacterium]|nr:four helix bundle protein [Candidatus Paceibacterota bacterium]
MEQYFPHEKLAVYGVALRYAAIADELLATWSSSWAVHGQFDRATESVVTNLAQAAGRRGTEAGLYSIECSLGSVLECAACMDVASIRGLVDMTGMQLAKEVLRQIARMEVGLRSSWENSVREEPEPYGTDSERYFLHESLEVYQRSLQVHRALEAIWQSGQARSRHVKRVDELTTSLTLNIAEGNGRFSKIDHRKFVATAEEAGTKLAAYLDLLVSSTPANIERVKSYLREVMAMLSGLKRYLDE